MRLSTGLFDIFRDLSSRSLESLIAGTSSTRLILCTWNPNVKGVEVSSEKAKSMHSQGANADIFGHAAIKLEINDPPEEVKEVLKSKYGEEGKKITRIEGVISWFPETDDNDHYIKTGEQFSDEQHNEFKAQQKIMMGEENYKKTAKLAASVRNFFSQGFAAINSTIEHDIEQYGPLTKDGV